MAALRANLAGDGRNSGRGMGAACAAALLDDFPGGGRSWVLALPPYNEHLVRDVGGLNLALAVLLVFAAIMLERRLVQVATIAALVYAVPHFAFHLAHLEELSTGDKVAQTAALALAVVMPLALFVLASRRTMS